MDDRWFSQHKSAIYLGGLLILSIVLFIVGHTLTRHSQVPSGAQLSQGAGTASAVTASSLGILLTNIAGAALAGAIATAFLSFSDVRNQIGLSITKMLSEGNLVKVLSPTARDTLRKEAYLADYAETTAFLEEELYRLLKKVSENSLSSPFVYNYNVTETTVRDPEDPAGKRTVSESTISYVLSAAHLRDTFEVPVRMVFETLVPDGVDINESNILIAFEAELDREIYGLDDVKITTRREAALALVRVEFEKKIKVINQVGVKVQYKSLGVLPDNVFILAARFPSKGFNLTFTYEEGYDFDATWFKTGDPTIEKRSDDIHVKGIDRGVRAIADGWVLPGEGVVVSWVEKHAKS